MRIANLIHMQRRRKSEELEPQIDQLELKLEELKSTKRDIRDAVLWQP